MSLLVTSCTMGKQPDRLLHKGPQYLRTRTNMGLFANHRKSAVELLAASKSQFYHHPGQAGLDKQQDLALSPRQSQRYNSAKRKESPLQREPSRSKSEYDLSQILQLTEGEEEEDSDLNNNDTSDESIRVAKLEVLEGTKRLSLEEKNHPRRLSGDQSAEQKLSSSPTHVETLPEDAENTPNVKNCVPSSSSSPALSKLYSRDKSETPSFKQNLPLSSRSKSQLFENRVKPTVPPRKPKTKPVPLPRKHALKSQSVKPSESLCPPSTPKDKVESTTKEVVTPPIECHGALIQSSHEIRHNVCANVVSQREKPKLKAATPKRKSLVESLTQHFTSLGSPSSPCAVESPKSPLEVGVKPGSGDNVITYTATPIFITKPALKPTNCIAKTVNHTDQEKQSEALIVSSQKPSVPINRRKRCPNVPASNKYSKRERKSSKPENFIPPAVNRSLSTPSSSERTKAEPIERRSSLQTSSKPEMSIDSVDEVVDMSEVNAAPFPEGSSEFEAMDGGEGDAREVSRTNSSLSGKLEPQDAITPAMIGPCFVPRSHSDINFRLEGEHSRDSSIVAKLSRASVGADLEKFFNQMGMERGILEPLAHLSELQTCEAFESVSSLDSQDAASICSTFSRSEQEWSESQSMDRLQQPTSVVERNARIIKWLCNVRKAKVPPGSAKPGSGAAASGAV